MAGLIKPERGEILVFGQNIAQMSEREASDIQRRTGFVFQYSALFDSLDVGHNIGFGLSQRPRFHRPSSREIRQTVARLLSEVGLPGIEGKQPSELSGGMKKRVAMARALASDPEVVFYDEPDSGLDPVMTSIIDDLIIKVRDQNHTTNIVVTHNVSSIWRIADRVLMIHDGNIVADGTTEEVERLDVEVVQQFLQGRTKGPLARKLRRMRSSKRPTRAPKSRPTRSSATISGSGLRVAGYGLADAVMGLAIRVELASNAVVLAQQVFGGAVTQIGGKDKIVVALFERTRAML